MNFWCGLLSIIAGSELIAANNSNYVGTADNQQQASKKAGKKAPLPDQILKWQKKSNQGKNKKTAKKKKKIMPEYKILILKPPVGIYIQCNNVHVLNLKLKFKGPRNICGREDLT